MWKLCRKSRSCIQLWQRLPLRNILGFTQEITHHGQANLLFSSNLARCKNHQVSTIRFVAALMAAKAHPTLGQLDLDLPRVGLHAAISSQLTLSGPVGLLEGNQDLGESFLNSVWIRRGQGLKLEICLSVDGEPITREDLQEVETAILHAEVIFNTQLYTASS